MPNEQLVVQLEARIRDFERQMQKATAIADRSAARIEKRFWDMNPKLSRFGKSAFVGVAQGATAALAPILTMTAAIRGTQEALKKLGAIADKSTAAGISAEFFQGVANTAELSGVEIESVAGALATFAKNAGLAAVEKGKLYSTLKAMNPELLRNIQLASTQEQRIRLVADAIKTTKDQASAAALAAAAFGDAGPKLVAAFQAGGAAIDDMVAKGKRSGAIIQNEIVARADAVGDSFDAAARIVDSQLSQALVRLGPHLVHLEESAAGFLGLVNNALDRFDELGNRTDLSRLQVELSDLENTLAPLKDKIADSRKELEGLADANPAKVQVQYALTLDEAAYADLMAKAQALQDRIYALQGMPAPSKPSWLPATIPPLAANDNAGGAKPEAPFAHTPKGQTRRAQEAALDPAKPKAFAAAMKEIEPAVQADNSAFEEMQKKVETAIGLGQDFANTIVSDLMSGKGAVDSLADAFDNLGSQLVEMGTNALISTLFTNLSGVGLGTPTGGTFGKGLWGSAIFGRASGGPVTAGQPYIVGEKRPELFVPNTAGRIVPDLGRIKAGGGSSVSVTLAPVIDARGADSEGIARLQRQLARMQAEIPVHVVKTLKRVKNRGYAV